MKEVERRLCIYRDEGGGGCRLGADCKRYLSEQEREELGSLSQDMNT